MWKEVEQDSKRATEIRATNRSVEDQNNENETTNNKIPLENKSDLPKPQSVEENNQTQEKKASDEKKDLGVNQQHDNNTSYEEVED